MNLDKKNNLICTALITISLLSFIFGFLNNEDLSTGGSSWDFNLIWPIVQEYTNFNFESEKSQITRHVPFHYLILSIFNFFFEGKNSVRFFYFIFSFLLPFFLYLNLNQLYKDKKLNILIISFAFFFLPFFRSSAIWANAHLTALIFFLIGNFYYLKSKINNKFSLKLLNLFFLSLATYSIQSYVILYLFYLYRYFVLESFKNFLYLFVISCFLGLPGLYFIYINPRIANLPFTKDIFFNFCFNFTIIFFYFLFFILNKKSILILFEKISQIKIFHLVLLVLFFLIILFNLNFQVLDSSLKGGGFFYKVSHFLFKNNSFFILIFFFSLILIFNLIKIEKNFLEIILIINLMSINLAVYQKYFEPSFLILIFVVNKNFLVKNTLSSVGNSVIFYLIIFSYFVVSYINYIYKFSYDLVI